MPPLLFTGLFVALWCWKCAMMVLFQNTIIYNPFLPPNSRSITIDEVSRDCGRVQWREERIKSLDGTEIALCVADVPPVSKQNANEAKTPVYVLYFQVAHLNPGNGSSLPPRLPDLSWIIRRAHENETSISYTMVCLSYRGYWTSHDRPSEPGIDLDSQAALRWIAQLHESRSEETDQEKPTVLLWGQSIGCGFATNLAAKGQYPPGITVDGLILETPFTNVRAMLQALYPQKWLPYQYLWPFLWNHLDSWTNLGMIAKRFPETPPGVYIVEAGKDELVPANHGEELLQRCRQVGLPVERQKVRGALHNEAMVRVAGKQALAHSISTAVTRARQCDLLRKGETLNNAGKGLT
ncbi:Alpha/Beta hydrolase protein [Fusarium acuminatum]|uniref:Alpha/Beta hydrolase protein n=1 Tax=Fusarium acuminatum TaxID=5515 RepID=A0ABZ2WFL4_9HYPO